MFCWLFNVFMNKWIRMLQQILARWYTAEYKIDLNITITKTKATVFDREKGIINS